MSHPRSGDSQNLPNGIPPQWGVGKSSSMPPVQMKQTPLNGVESSHSSRDPSPIVNLANKIPSQQLPPQRSAIPQSQLPPRSAQSPLQISRTPPNGGAKNPTFTSTPIVDRAKTVTHDNGAAQISAFSPVTPNRTVDTVKSAFKPTQTQNFPANNFPQQYANVPARNTPNPAVSSPMQNVSSASTQPPPANQTATQNKTSPAPTASQNLISQQSPLNRPYASQPFNQNQSPMLSNSSPVRPNPIPQQNKLVQPIPLLQNQPQQQIVSGNQTRQPPTYNQPQPYQTAPPMYSHPSLQTQPTSQNPINPMQTTRPVHNANQLSEVPLSKPYGNVNHLPNPPPTNLQPNSSPYGGPRPVQQQQQSYPPNVYNPSAAAPSPRYSQAPAVNNTSQQPSAAFGRNAVHSNRYPAAAGSRPSQNVSQNQYQNAYNNQSYVQPNVSANNYQNAQMGNNSLNQQFSNMSVVQSGFNKMWGAENFDLLQCPNILPHDRAVAPKVSLGQDFLDAANCSSDIFRCTMTKIPESNSLLQKSRLPLGILIHPFKDLNQLPVIQCNTIVRCRACRTYINPFVFFVDSKRWKCNLCYRVNELPEEFQYDPVSKSYGDPSRRPEIKSSTIEYIAPSEYMLRPPQPAVYLYLLDISHAAVESGYLQTICDVLSSQLETLPGDARTQIGFIAYDSALHFFALGEGLSQPHEMTVLDIDDVFLPCPDNLLVNLKERFDLVSDLLTQLPARYTNSFDTGSALGAALQAAYKMMFGTGGRISVFQASLPTVGPGALTSREDPNQRAASDAPHLNPATDFYKRLALDCSGQQIAVDLFLINSQYIDLATISGISRFSGGCIYHFPLFKVSRVLEAEHLERCFKRYLTRKIGFESVMRIRCTRGLSIHTFHGNFFVRSTDLLSLPNINPDAGFGMQVAIEENLSDIQTVSFQAAVLYTSSKGERRIRVHTMCLPIVANLSDVLNSADQQCIIGLLSKMAVDRSLQSSLSDARDAFINVAIDILSSYKLSLNMSNSPTGLLAPYSLRLLPLYLSALLKHKAFRTGTSTRLDDRVCAMCEMKSLPLPHLIQQVYPDLYPIHNIEECPTELDSDGVAVPQPIRLQLTARSVDNIGAYLLDKGEQMLIMVCAGVSQTFLREVLGVADYNSISEQFYELPTLDTIQNQSLHAFINSLNDEKPYVAPLQVIRENSQYRVLFIENLIEDRMETALSYHEFLQHLKTQVK